MAPEVTVFTHTEYVFSETLIHTQIFLLLYTCLNYFIFSDTDSHSSREEDQIVGCMQLHTASVLARGEHPSLFIGLTKMP